ncbi:small cysteine-rich protein 1 2-like [Acropora muricata]|uniref:small cysteine-rich protein 1 2-like n=1 Tax=Acropora millepora TaxID=45264 RepID=UPI0010FCDA93|nr:small cysteine-rich protein 1 2-like [Acropora millepora]
MGVKLNMCLLLLLVTTVSLQGFKLREKNDDIDENLLRLLTPQDTECQRDGGHCISKQYPCPYNTWPIFNLPDCEKCCRPTAAFVNK